MLVSSISLFAVHEYTNFLYFAILMTILFIGKLLNVKVYCLVLVVFLALGLKVLVFILVQFCRS